MSERSEKRSTRRSQTAASATHAIPTTGVPSSNTTAILQSTSNATNQRHKSAKSRSESTNKQCPVLHDTNVLSNSAPKVNPSQNEINTDDSIPQIYFMNIQGMNPGIPNQKWKILALTEEKYTIKKSTFYQYLCVCLN